MSSERFGTLRATIGFAGGRGLRKKSQKKLIRRLKLAAKTGILGHIIVPALTLSRVLLFIHDAKRKIRIFCVSWRSAMNFVRESVFAGPMRNSGSAWRSAFATTSSDGAMPGRMVATRIRTSPEQA